MGGLLLPGLDLVHGVDHGVELGRFGLVDQIALIDAGEGSMRGDRHDMEAVGAGELGGLGLGGAGHARQLVVHAEVVLERDRGEGLVLLLDLHALLGLDRLMQALGPASALEDASGELVDDAHFAVLDDVLLVALEQFLGLERRLKLMHEVLRDLVVHVLHAERPFDRFDAGIGGSDRALLLVDVVMDVALQPTDDRCELIVDLGGIGDAARDDERCARLVDEDRVDLVDDAEVETALHLIGPRHRHVVAQIVEAELVVRAIRDVGVVLLTLVLG